ncbi:putative ribonuclease H-like domain-containing protein [Tanacetum coccineum]|uniref:Ribonuclease H-like domain-containing protein n=1 Tax=Tanacetum coccineum TaxID=301880 RepID=A0ABQ4WHP6_9ASTR
MLADSKLPTTFWAEAVSTACYVQNRVLIVKPHNKTPYELFRGFKPAIGFMKPFGCHVTILNTLDNLGKFDGKSDEGFFVGYSLSSKAFRVYNTRTRKVQENLHIGFLENKPMIEGNGPKWLFDIDSLTQSMNYVPVVAGTFSNDFAGIQRVSESSTSSQQDQDCIVMPIWKDASYFGDAAPRSVADAQIQDKDRLHDENDASEKSPDDSSLKDNGTVVQQVNTARPKLYMGHASEDTQMEDQEAELGNIPPSYPVLITPHTRIHKDHPINLVIGDVKSSVKTRRMTTSYSELGFLSAIYEGKTHQDLHTCFEDPDHPDKVYKVVKALYGLHQAPRAWYDTLANYLLCNGFQKGPTEKKGNFISQHKYGNEILRKFKLPHYISMIGSLMYLTASRPDIMFAVYACARFQVSPKTSHLLAVKRIFRYLKGKPSLGLWYSKDSHGISCYTDSDFCLDAHMIGRVNHWSCPSTTEAEYVAAASCCGQVLWIQNQLLDYGYNFMNTVIYIDNNSTICIIENPVQHSKTKHIEIRHHFIRDCNAKKLIQMAKIDTENNVADLLTKGFDAGRFQYLVSSIGMLNP